MDMQVRVRIVQNVLTFGPPALTMFHLSSMCLRIVPAKSRPPCCASMRRMWSANAVLVTRDERT